MGTRQIIIIASIQNHLGLPKNRSVELVESILEIIKKTLENGENLMLGSRKIITFKCSSVLKDNLNGNRKG